MYLRAVHAEKNLSALYDFVRANPLGIFTTAIESKSFPFLQSSHIPFVLDATNEENPSKLGFLRGHLARANPQAKALIENTTSATEIDNGSVPGSYTLSRDVMILFNGSAHHYVTPKFYEETKPSTGKVVPTWNYSAVQVYGRATIHYDAKASATSSFLDKQIRDLSIQCETDMGHKDNPWVVEDAPPPYIEIMKKAIVGVEIEILDIGGKYKMSQELSEGDRKGVIEGFKMLSSDLGLQMSNIVQERGQKKE